LVNAQDVRSSVAARRKISDNAWVYWPARNLKGVKNLLIRPATQEDTESTFQVHKNAVENLW